VERHGVADRGAIVPGSRELRRELRQARKDIKRLRVETEQLNARLAQVRFLRMSDPGLGARLDGLAAVLDPDRTATHARSAIAGASIVSAPVPHAVIPSLLPDDVHRALVEAIPARELFADAGDGRLDVSVPPPLAPVDSVVAWRFVAGLVRETLGPAFVELMRPVLGHRVRALGGATIEAARMVASLGRLIRREPGYVGESGRGQPWDLLTVVVCLAGPADGRCGSELRDPRGNDQVRIVVGRPNTALVMLDGGGAHAHTAVPAGQACVSYQFPIGPDAIGRRALTLPALG
jgi:hypothetical protein